MNKSETITKLASALVKAQSEMSNAVKDSKNPFFKSSYADLNSVREACIPALNKHGITVLQPTIYVDGKPFVQTLLLHESGEYLASVTEIICDKANNAQSHGSGVTYARRYGLQSMCNIGSEDDDGNAASGNNHTQNEKAKEQPTTTAPEEKEVWLNKFTSKAKTETTKEWKNTIEKLMSGKVSLKQVESVYKLSKEIKVELQKIADAVPQKVEYSEVLPFDNK